MNKAELINAVTARTGLSKKSAVAAVDAVFDVMTQTVASGERVQIVGFGAFEVKTRAAHIGRNPRTREEVTVPASTVPAFKPGKAFKEAVSKNEA